MVDAMGRVIRLDEPTTSGLGSTSSPNQATAYEYDLLDNLVHITQGSQHRYFKYDSLSRLIREKQVEQVANSTYNLSDAWNTGGTWTRKIDYNSAGLVTGAHDARGVDTTFSYDDLHRVTTIAYSDSTPVRVKGTNYDRITLIDGGYHNEWAIELWTGFRVPTIPTVNRSKVQILRRCTPSRQKRRASFLSLSVRLQH